LLAEIKRCKRTGDKVDDRYYDKYNSADVKLALKKMYNSLCCYCESEIDIVSFPHIEHRKPKRSQRGVPRIPYPQETYNWDNLHLVCSRCNNAKGSKYNVRYPILDAALDWPIEQHFQYDEGYDGIIWFPLTLRAKTTEEHTDLNRDELTHARLKIFTKVIFILSKIKQDPRNPGNRVAMTELRKKIKGPYGSLIRFLVETFE
jgi:uncharacterized protein (TIGR02646 family)